MRRNRKGQFLHSVLFKFTKGSNIFEGCCVYSNVYHILALFYCIFYVLFGISNIRIVIHQYLSHLFIALGPY